MADEKADKQKQSVMKLALLKGDKVLKVVGITVAVVVLVAGYKYFGWGFEKKPAVAETQPGAIQPMVAAPSDPLGDAMKREYLLRLSQAANEKRQGAPEEQAKATPPAAQAQASASKAPELPPGVKYDAVTEKQKLALGPGQHLDVVIPAYHQLDYWVENTKYVELMVPDPEKPSEWIPLRSLRNGADQVGEVRFLNVHKDAEFRLTVQLLQKYSGGTN